MFLSDLLWDLSTAPHSPNSSVCVLSPVLGHGPKYRVVRQWWSRGHRAYWLGAAGCPRCHSNLYPEMLVLLVGIGGLLAVEWL